jgi:hypothetical protein
MRSKSSRATVKTDGAGQLIERVEIVTESASGLALDADVVRRVYAQRKRRGWTAVETARQLESAGVEVPKTLLVEVLAEMRRNSRDVGQTPEIVFVTEPAIDLGTVIDAAGRD